MTIDSNLLAMLAAVGGLDATETAELEQLANADIALRRNLAAGLRSGTIGGTGDPQIDAGLITVIDAEADLFEGLSPA